MSVSRLDKDGDWTFGQQLAGYIRGSEEVKQNVLTRIKSFQRDCFMDQSAEIDWFNILQNKNTQQVTENQITRTVLGTAGVTRLDELNLVIDTQNRKATVFLTYTDIYENTQTIDTGVQ